MAIIKNILLREDYLRLGMKGPISWDMEAAAHVCCFGATGSGKTYLIKLILGKTALCDPTARLTVCDGKGDGKDFGFLSGCERYASVDVGSLFERYYNAFLARQRGEERGNDSMVLMFDEWSAYIDSLDDKKSAEVQKKRLGNLLRLGRSFNFHVVLGQQRMDSSYFQGFRENFNVVIGLSNLSKESRDMFFSEFRDQIEPNRARGMGYMTVNGTGFVPVAVPTITDIDKLHRTIREAVTR